MENEFFAAKTDDIAPGTSQVCQIEGKFIAIFNDGGTFRAIDDMCPHAGASLGEGWLDDGCVTCPWHAWQFRLSDGAYMQNLSLKVETFPVRIQDGDIFVTIPPAK